MEKLLTTVRIISGEPNLRETLAFNSTFMTCPCPCTEAQVQLTYFWAATFFRNVGIGLWL